MPTTITGTSISLTQGGNTLSAGPTSAVAKAWVNFNGTGTVSIRGSSNVSSVTDLGTGNYKINFTTSMVDANYCVNTTCNHAGGNSTSMFATFDSLGGNPSVSDCRIFTFNNAFSLVDASYVFTSIIR
jgi:hypothetical protein